MLKIKINAVKIYLANIFINALIGIDNRDVKFLDKNFTNVLYER